MTVFWGHEKHLIEAVKFSGNWNIIIYELHKVYEATLWGHFLSFCTAVFSLGVEQELKIIC